MPFIDYTDHGDGSFSFHDDAGTTTPPMAGPAAVQQKNKIDMSGIRSPRIRGERAELSPEMLDAGGDITDARMAGLIPTPTLAPHRSLVDVGGARGEVPPSASDVGAPLQALNEKQAAAGLPITKPILPEAAAQKPKEQSFSDETVPEADRVQVNLPRPQGLQFAPAPGGGGSAPQLKEVKAGETYGYTEYDPDAQKRVVDAYQNKHNVGDQMTANVEKAGANLTTQLAEIPAGLTNLEQNRQAMEDTIAQRVQEDHEHLDQLRRETRQDIDPNAFWKNKTAGEKFMGALAMGIGAYVQTMTGGQNNAMNILNSAIRDEIDAQKSNKAASHQRFQDMRGQMSERRQLFADERQNFLAKKVAYLELADRKLGTYMQEAKTDEQKAQIADMQANVAIEAEKMRAEFGKVSHQVQTKVIQTGPAKPVNTSGVSEFEHERYVPQFEGLAPDKETRAIASAKGASLDTFKYLTAENLRLREQAGAYVKGTDAHAKLASNQAQLILLTKRKENEDLGVIAGPDMGLMVDALGDGTSIVPGQSAALQNFLSNQKRINENVRKNLGLIPVETMPVRDDKTGETRIAQRVTGNVITPKNVTGRYDAPVQTVHIAKTSRQEKK
jgi:hypothetical protein